MEEADKLCERVAIVDHGKLVALDTPTRLKDTIPANEVVEVEFAGAPANWHEALASLPRVLGVTEHEGVTHITSQDGAETLGAVMDLARRRGVRASRVTIHGTTLDDVFLHFTGRQLRDELGAKRLDISHLYR
jgi:ABC-2 type transport system ATP-binding protein